MIARLSIAALLIATPAFADQIEGQARILDGDTVEITAGERVEKIRLLGIDTPEKAQLCGLKFFECGAASKEHLSKLVGDRDVKCEWSERERWGRALGICHARTKGKPWMKKSLNHLMVLHGQAFAYVGYSNEFAGAMHSAMKKCRGVWANSDLAWCWRKGRRGK